ncbi:MAG: DUF3846 domain-containing protein [Oscillospiraceae bacterium]|nr:DUF3846 domain-containing protein [Oscillospiraceae bacterium]
MKDKLLRVIKNGKWIAVENTLGALQKEVGGYIETLTLFDGVVMIIDEEGRLKNKPETCTVLKMPIVGDWLIVGANDEGEFTDLPFESWQIMKTMGVLKW